MNIHAFVDVTFWSSSTVRMFVLALQVTAMEFVSDRICVREADPWKCDRKTPLAVVPDPR